MRHCLVDRDIDDESFDNWSETKTIAKSRHECIECGRVMRRGMSHWIFKGWREGKLSGRYRTCLSCYEIRERFCCDWLFGAVLEDVSNELYENGGELELGCLDELSPDAQDFIIDALEAAWEESE